MAATKGPPPALQKRLAAKALEEQDELQRREAEVQGTATFDELVKAVREMRSEQEEKERLEAEAKQHADRYNELRKQIIPELMQKLGLVKNGKGQFMTPDGKVHLETKVFANCAEANRANFHAWLRKNGHEDLVKETVNAQTLSAFIRERREGGEGDPPYVGIHEETVAKLTKR